ncbi:MAG: hypothetical protein AAB686_03155 [Patescibacteria group bacterium]
MVQEILETIGQIILRTWWLWAFLILRPLAASTWLFWRQEKFKDEIKWVLLEMRIPREVRKSPRAMEQVLAALHQLRNAPYDIREKWWDGEVTRWFSLELVSFGGELHFYVRVYHKQRNLLEAAFFSYYPDVELVEIDDYVNRIPANIQELYSQGYNVWGTEMVLRREDAYPIKTYEEFVESSEEEKQYDPIAAFLEVLGKVKKEEMVGIQLLIAPGDVVKWRKDWEHLVEELRQSKGHSQAKSKVYTKSEFPGFILPAFSVVKTDTKDEPGFFKSFMRTPGETDVLKAIEENISKPAFDTLVRFIYLSPQTIFYDSYARRGLTGAFNQYAALDMNSFVPNYPTSTRTRFWQWPHIFHKVRNEYRKQRLLHNYRYRKNPVETWMGKLMTSHLFSWNFFSRRFSMNTECLATLYHPPIFLVLTAPHFKRLESRKAGPPAGLAIYGEETEIEKFQQ